MAGRRKQRSAGRRFAALARALAAVLVVGGVLAWVLSRLLTDRFVWSQPVWWVPSPVLLGPLWIAGVCGLVRWASRARRVGRGRVGVARRVGDRRGWAARVVGAAAVLTLLVVLFGEMGLHRVLVGRAGAGEGERVRLVFWNQAGHRAGDLGPVFVPLEPTVLVLANRHSDSSTGEVARAFAETGPVHAAVGWPFDVFSRLPVRRWASTSLGLEGRSRAANDASQRDSGWAAWYELETAGGTLVVWAIDLPSDPRAHRVPLAREAGRTLASWSGAVRVREGDGYRYEKMDRTGFPAPDVVVGDFNIPRGSASLGVLLEEAGAAGMRDAFDVAGFGWRRTWPREWPVWAIDHCFVGEGVRARSFETRDPGVGGHRVLVVECARDGR